MIFPTKPFVLHGAVVESPVENPYNPNQGSHS